MGNIFNIMAGLIGAVALNLVHEKLRKTVKDAPKIHLIGEQALNKTLGPFGAEINNKDELYLASLAGDIISNTLFYSLIGGKPKYVWPKAIFLGLTAGIGAIKMPSKMGLNDYPVTKTNQTKVMTVGYYLFGALVTGLMLKILIKNKTR